MTSHDKLPFAEFVRGLDDWARANGVQIGCAHEAFPLQYPGDPARDVDLWVSAEQSGALTAHLEDLGAGLIIARQSECWPSQRIYLLELAEGLVQLDMNIEFYGAAFVRYARVAELVGPAGLGRLPPDTEIFGRLFKILLRRGPAAAVDWPGLVHIYQRLGPVERDRLSRFLGWPQRKTGDAFAGGGALSRKRIAFVAKVASFFFASLLREPGSITILARKLRWRRGASPFGRRTSGLVVAAIGTDGTGKSTLLAALKEKLEGHGYITARIYMGRGRDNVIVTSNVSSISRELAGSHPSLKRPLMYMASWVYLFDYMLRLLRVGLAGSCRQEIVLCDRYVYDIAYMQTYSRLAYRLLRALTPKPDILVGLDCSVELLAERKAERSRAEYDRQKEVTARILSSKSSAREIVTFDTGHCSVEEMTGTLTARILRLSHRHYDY